MTTETNIPAAENIAGFNPEALFSSLSEGKYIVLNESHSEPLVRVHFLKDDQRVLVPRNGQKREIFSRVTPAEVIEFINREGQSPQQEESLTLQKYILLKALEQQVRTTAAPGTFYSNMEESFEGMLDAKDDTNAAAGSAINVSGFYKCFIEALSQTDFYLQIAVFLEKKFKNEMAALEARLNNEMDYVPRTPHDLMILSATNIYNFVSTQNKQNWQEQVPQADMMQSLASRKNT